MLFFNRIAKSTYSLAHICFFTLSGTWCVNGTAEDKKVFLLGGETTSQGNKEPVTCCTAEFTVCCTDRSVFLGERLVSAMSEPPFTCALSPTVGSGTNCIPGMHG